MVTMMVLLMLCCSRLVDLDCRAAFRQRVILNDLGEMRNQTTPASLVRTQSSQNHMVTSVFTFASKFGWPGCP